MLQKEDAKNVLKAIAAAKGLGPGGTLNPAFADGHAIQWAIRTAEAGSLEEAQQKAEIVLYGRCKRGGCQEPAIRNGQKRYCVEHHAAYVKRRNAEFAKPACTGPDCNVRTSRVDERDGKTPLCGRCQQERDLAEQKELFQERREKQRKAEAYIRRHELESAETVADLVAFLVEHGNFELE